VWFSLSGICVVLYLIVQSLNILVKGHAARYLRKAVSLNGYLSMLIGVFVTIMVQSSSITTSVLTPLVAVGLIPLEDMYPLTLGANIGTTITGILAATVVTSNPVEVCHTAVSPKMLITRIISTYWCGPEPHLGGFREYSIISTITRK
jgi:sodium-dependent phosphate cotransporter